MHRVTVCVRHPSLNSTVKVTLHCATHQSSDSPANHMCWTKGFSLDQKKNRLPLDNCDWLVDLGCMVTCDVTDEYNKKSNIEAASNVCVNVMVKNVCT